MLEPGTRAESGAQPGAEQAAEKDGEKGEMFAKQVLSLPPCVPFSQQNGKTVSSLVLRTAVQSSGQSRLLARSDIQPKPCFENQF